MTWFAFKGYNGGQPIDVAGIQEKNLVLWGFHGYGTKAMAIANPNTVNAAQRLIVDSAIADYNLSKPAGGGIGSFANVPGNAADAASAGIGDVTGLRSIGDFFHRITEKQTWTRVGEVAFGGVLLVVGVKALSRGTTAAAVTKTASKPVRSTAKKVATVAAPEFRVAGRVAAKRVAPKTTARVSRHREYVRQYGGKKPYRGQ